VLSLVEPAFLIRYYYLMAFRC